MTRRWCCDFSAKIETWPAVISPYLKIRQRGVYIQGYEKLKNYVFDFLNVKTCWIQTPKFGFISWLTVVNVYFCLFNSRILLKNEIKDKMGTNKPVNGITWKLLVKEVNMDTETRASSIWRNDRLSSCGAILLGGFKGSLTGIC